MTRNFFYYLLIFSCCFVIDVTAQQSKTFTNPLLPAGADPWCIYKNGFYYYTHTTGKNITVWKTKSIASLKTAKKKTFASIFLTFFFYNHSLFFYPLLHRDMTLHVASAIQRRGQHHLARARFILA